LTYRVRSFLWRFTYRLDEVAYRLLTFISNGVEMMTGRDTVANQIGVRIPSNDSNLAVFLHYTICRNTFFLMHIFDV